MTDTPEPLDPFVGDLFAPCVICADTALVAINGRTYCHLHVDVGFIDIARVIAIFRGLNVEDTERLARLAITR